MVCKSGLWTCVRIFDFDYLSGEAHQDIFTNDTTIASALEVFEDYCEISPEDILYYVWHEENGVNWPMRALGREDVVIELPLHKPDSLMSNWPGPYVALMAGEI